MQIITSSGVVEGTGRSSTLLIGYPRTGKTTFIGTATDHEKLFLISLERGTLSISDKKFDMVEANNHKEFKEALNWFMVNCKDKGYTALGLDSFSRLQQYIIDELLEQDGIKNGKVTRDHYNMILAQMKKYVDVLTKQADFAFISTCMAGEAKDEESGVIKVQPALQGQFKFDIAGYFDTVLLTKTGKDKDGKQVYWSNVTGDDRSVCGSRLPHLRGIQQIKTDYSRIINKA